MLLPFVTAPKPAVVRKIGTPASGIIEVEQRGGLTVGESATVSELLALEDSAFVKGAQIADAIAKEEQISLSEAYGIIESAISGRALEEQAQAIRLRHAGQIEQVARVFAAAGQRNMEASVTAIIRSRLQRPEWSMDDTRKMDRVLFNGLWQLVLEEQAAEDLQVEPVTEEELGKPRAAAGKGRKPNG